MSDVARFPIFVCYVRAYGECRSDPSRDPYHGAKERPWWPMQYYMDDDLLGAWVYRIRARSRCEVGLFLAADHELYVKDSGIKGALIFLLTQTFHLLGKMEVHFVGARPGQKASLDTGFEPVIPASIRRVSSSLGIEFSNTTSITDAEGRQLYARLTGLTEEAIARLRQRGIDPTRACFVVQRDIWAFDQVDYLMKHAHEPERLFDGGASPVRRFSYQHDLLVLRPAILEERLRIFLDKFSGRVGASVSSKWIGPSVVRYSCDADLNIPVLERPGLPLRAGTPLDVALIPRNAQGYAAFGREDFAPRDADQARVVAVTKDFEWAGISPKAWPRTLFIPLFDSLADLDLEIGRRLTQAVTSRSELSERHD